MERHLASVWEAIADEIPDEAALVQGDVRRSWAAFDDRAARLAGALGAAGLQPGSKVAQYLYNAPEYMETYAATLKMRAVPINVNYRYLDDELLYLLENSDAEALIFHSSLGDRVERVMPRFTKLKVVVEVDDGGPHLEGTQRYEDLVTTAPAPRISRSPDDVTMIYTGGTTGMPKGVMGRIGPGIDTLMATVPPILGLPPLDDPAQIPAMARRMVDEGRQFAGLPACPLMHATGLAIGTLPALTFGGRVVLLTSRGLDVDELWDTVAGERVNAITVVGDAFARPMLRGLREGPDRDLSSVMMMLSSGAMLSAEIRAGLLEHVPGAMVIDYIAATEGLMGFAVSTKDALAPTGRFSPAPGVVVLDEAGQPVEAGSGVAGMVAIGGATSDGYYKDADKTADTFRVIEGVRYSIPGDWAEVEADGAITLLGRGSQCINTGGEKVYPEEVEEVIKVHPGVDDCLVFGVSDERFGQRVVGVASLSPGADASPAEILDGAKARLSSYKLPRQLVVVDTVPRAPNGKADYPTAKELFAAAPT